MAEFRIPVTNVPQQFQIQLAGKNYLMTCKWNDAPEGGWCLDLADAETGDAILANINIVTGINILSGLEYLGINGELYCRTNGDQFADPTLQNLGQESFLYFDTEVVDG